jgi:hypothetical protein
MPLYVRVSPSEPGKKDIRGPYPEKKLEALRESSKILSARSKIQKTWEIIWVCSRGKNAKSADIVYVFENGKRTFPKGKVGEKDHKRFIDLKACMLSSEGMCGRGLDDKSDPKKLIKGRKRKVFVPCPIPSRSNSP